MYLKSIFPHKKKNENFASRIITSLIVRDQMYGGLRYRHVDYCQNLYLISREAPRDIIARLRGGERERERKREGEKDRERTIANEGSAGSFRGSVARGQEEDTERSTRISRLHSLPRDASLPPAAASGTPRTRPCTSPSPPSSASSSS